MGLGHPLVSQMSAVLPGRATGRFPAHLVKAKTEEKPGLAHSLGDMDNFSPQVFRMLSNLEAMPLVSVKTARGVQSTSAQRMCLHAPGHGEKKGLGGLATSVFELFE